MAAHITVELRSSIGGDLIETLEPRGANVGDVMPEFDDERYPFLRYVDPNGDTAFSSYQMTAVIPELVRLHESSHDAVLAEVVRLAEKCQGRRSYLIFLGD
jgi:hypothetical protein